MPVLLDQDHVVGVVDCDDSDGGIMLDDFACCRSAARHHDVVNPNPGNLSGETDAAGHHREDLRIAHLAATATGASETSIRSSSLMGSRSDSRYSRAALTKEKNNG